MSKKYWPTILNIITFALAQALMILPQYFYYFVLAIIVSIIASVYFYIGNKPLHLAWLKFLILPLLFWSGLLFYISLIPYSGLVLTLFVQFWFFLGLWFLFAYLRQAKKLLSGEENNLELWFSVFSFLSVFLLAAAVYGWQSFLAWPTWPLALGLTAAASLLCYELIWLNSPDKSPERLLSLAIPFTFLQMVWVLFFLPFDYHILALLFVLYFYLSTSLVTFYLRRTLEKKTIRQLLVFFGICLAFVMLLVKWN